MPDLQALHDQYKDQGFLVLSISDEEMARGSPFIAGAQDHLPGSARSRTQSK